MAAGAALRDIDSRSREAVMVLVFAVCVILPCADAHAQAIDQAPSERSLVLAAIRLLEQEPLGNEARLLRGPLMQWLVATPHVQLEPCPALLWPFANGTRAYGEELLAHTMLASAAFILEHPDSSANRLAVGRAGMLGCLRVYERIMRQHPATRFPELDEMIERRDYGEFDEYLAGLLEQCEVNR